MAIIKNGPLVVAHGSVGNLTFRTVKGQTVVSEKITRNRSKTPKQVGYRMALREISRLSLELDSCAKTGFVPTERGTVRNQFFRQNNDLYHYYARQTDLGAREPAVFHLHKALSDKRFLGQVLSGRGASVLVNSFEWDAERCVKGLLELDRDFRRNDRLYFYLIVIYQSGRYLSYRLLDHSLYLTDKDITRWGHENVLLATKELVPIFDRSRWLWGDERLAGVVTTALLHNAEERSTSTFIALCQEEVVNRGV